MQILNSLALLDEQNILTSKHLTQSYFKTSELDNKNDKFVLPELSDNDLPFLKLRIRRQHSLHIYNIFSVIQWHIDNQEDTEVRQESQNRKVWELKTTHLHSEQSNGLRVSWKIVFIIYYN